MSIILTFICPLFLALVTHFVDKEAKISFKSVIKISLVGCLFLLLYIMVIYTLADIAVLFVVDDLSDKELCGELLILFNFLIRLPFGILFYLYTRKHIKLSDNLHTIKKNSINMVAILCIDTATTTACYVFNGDNSYSESDYAFQYHLIAFICSFFVYAFGALLEECIYRGIIYNMCKGISFEYAVICSSIIFAFGHKEGSIYLRVLFGVLMCLLFEKTKSLLACTIVHAVSNTTLSIDIVTGKISEAEMLIIITVILSIILVINRKDFSLNEITGEDTEKERIERV